IYLEAPDIVTKTLALMDRAQTQEEQIHYLFHLRNLKTGWTPEHSRQYFSWWTKDRKGVRHTPEVIQWFADVDRDYQDGASFPKFLAAFKKDAVASLTETERDALRPLLESTVVAAQPQRVQRDFVKEWKMTDLTGELEKVASGRSFQ